MGTLSRLGGVALGLAPLLPQVAVAGVVDSPHNLSATGPGAVHATDETEVCLFCHANHVEATTGPLWNRNSTGQLAYRPYESDLATGDQPDGVTLMCLSCHDGTVAVGVVASRDSEIRMTGGAFGNLQPGRGSFGADLSGTHPVSIDYAAAATRDGLLNGRTHLKALPDALGTRALLDRQGRVQCTACHDPHEDPASPDLPPFWKGDTTDQVCTACHEAPLINTGHTDPSALPMGCGSCHVGHGVARQPLLPATEEEACYDCHGSSVNLARPRAEGRLSRSANPTLLRAQFNKPYTHPVGRSTGLHHVGEDSREGAPITRHVECVDCHPIHGQPRLSGPSALGAPHTPRHRGDRSPTEVDGRIEHELCYDCHAQGSVLPYGQTDKSAEFNPSNASYHPVEAPLGRRDVPSLRSPWTAGQVMSCSDCHGSDDPDDPPGPHGSRNKWILKGAYTAADGTPESAATYQACYACHGRSSILSNDSFAGHNQHIVEVQASCYACHDSHGSPDAPGLIRFGKDFRYTTIRPSSSGRLEYLPQKGGSCYLTCHDVDHDPLGYP